MLKIVEEFSTDIRMEFEMDKCRTINKRNTTSRVFPDTTTERPWQEGNTYKYLGIQQAQIDHGAMKDTRVLEAG